MPRVTAAVWTDDDVPQSVLDDYDRVVTVLLDLGLDQGGPIDLELTPEAMVAWKEYHDPMARDGLQAALDGDEDLAAVLAKLRGCALRLALAIALERAAEAGPEAAASLRLVDRQDMEAGITLGKWLVEQAGVIYSTWRIAEDEPKDLVDLIDRLGGATTVRILMRHTRRFRSAGEAKAALDALEVAGHGKWERQPAKNGLTVSTFVLAAQPG
jgi:hypothetical protein